MRYAGQLKGQFGFAVNSAREPALAIDQIAPGNSLVGWIVFTVPTRSGYVLLTYRDNLFDGTPDDQWKGTCC